MVKADLDEESSSVLNVSETVIFEKIVTYKHYLWFDRYRLKKTPREDLDKKIVLYVAFGKLCLEKGNEIIRLSSFKRSI